MNLDHAQSGSDCAEYLDYVQGHEQKMREHRSRIVLPDGHIIFKCAHNGCKHTAGSVVNHQGRKRFKINLIRNAPKLDGSVDSYGMDVDAQTGGKCQGKNCRMVHKFAFEEIAQVLGFVDCEEALTPYLKRGRKFSDCNAEVSAAWFLLTYIVRNDESYKAFQSRLSSHSDFVYQYDYSERRFSEHGAPAEVEDADESDPFADDD